jgi:type II secretory pathway component PulM
MSSGYWQNLRPFEKRVVVGVGAVFFIVLNALLVWPHFSDLHVIKTRMADAQEKLTDFQNEIAQTPKYERLVRSLETEGLAVPAEEQAFQFNNTINAQAGQSGVQILSNGRLNTATNQFFVEKSQNISLQAGEPQLVDFLYTLGSSNSLIRVRDLDVRPEPNHHALVATVKLVASYQKKMPTRPASNKTAIPTTKRP